MGNIAKLSGWWNIIVDPVFVVGQGVSVPDSCVTAFLPTMTQLHLTSHID
jgi:hypothetical protein